MITSNSGSNLNVHESINKRKMSEIETALGAKGADETDNRPLKKPSTSNVNKEVDKISILNLEKLESSVVEFIDSIEKILSLAPSSTTVRDITSNFGNDIELALTASRPNIVLGVVLKNLYKEGRLQFFEDVINFSKTGSFNEKKLNDLKDICKRAIVLSSQYQNRIAQDANTQLQSQSKLSQDRKVVWNTDPNLPQKDVNNTLIPPTPINAITATTTYAATESDNNESTSLSIPSIDDSLLEQVLTHKSFSDQVNFLKLTNNESSTYKIINNEKLRFVGSAILREIITIILYKNYPNESTDTLVNAKSALLSDYRISEWAEKYHLPDKIRCTLSTEEIQKKHVAAGLFEAYVGAIYQQDNSYDRIKKWIEALLGPQVDSFLKAAKFSVSKDSGPADYNSKNNLFALIGSTRHVPTYEVIVQGNSCRDFKVACKLMDDVLGIGTGQNLKEAGLRAASAALKNKGALQKYIELKGSRQHSPISQSNSQSSQAYPFNQVKQEDDSNGSPFPGFSTTSYARLVNVPKQSGPSSVDVLSSQNNLSNLFPQPTKTKKGLAPYELPLVKKAYINSTSEMCGIPSKQGAPRVSSGLSSIRLNNGNTDEIPPIITDSISDLDIDRGSKNTLYAILSQYNMSPPIYETFYRKDTTTSPTILVKTSSGIHLATGTSSSKKKAERKAAMNALKNKAMFSYLERFKSTS